MKEFFNELLDKFLVKEIRHFKQIRVWKDNFNFRIRLFVIYFSSFKKVRGEKFGCILWHIDIMWVI